MKSYDEIYQNVLRRRDEQIARKRRRIAVMGSVLPVSVLTLAAVFGIAALQGKPLAESEVSGNANASAAQLSQTAENAAPPVKLVDNRLILEEVGASIDITDMISDEVPYIYEYAGSQTDLVNYVVAGGTPENYGWAKFVMYERDTDTPENSKWSCRSYNTLASEMQDRRWYEAALRQLSEKPENNRIIIWSMTERTWEQDQEPFLPEDGENVKVADLLTVDEDSLDGYTACLVLKNEVGTDGADGRTKHSFDDALIIVDNADGDRASIAASELSGNSYIYDMILIAVNGKHPETALKLFSMDYKGEKHYLLALRSDMSLDEVSSVFVKPFYSTLFFAVEPECFDSGRLELYKCNGLANYSVGIGDGFRLDRDNVFVDVGDSTIHSIFVFDPDTLNFSFNQGREALLGGNFEAADAHLYGYHAFVEMKNVTHVPTGQEDHYSAEDTVLTVFGPDGGSAVISLKECGSSKAYEEFAKNLTASHAEECVTLLKLNDNGKEHIVIMLRNYQDKELPSYHAVFFEFDPESLTLIPYEYGKHEIVITPIVEVENVEGRDMLFTEKADRNDIANINAWDYIAACCNKALEFDHENHTVSYYLPLCEF